MTVLYLAASALRTLDKGPKVRVTLESASTKDCLSFFTADLLHDVGWAEACAGCDYVVHVAASLAATKIKPK